MLRQHTVVGVGSTVSLRPIICAHKHDQSLLSRIDHAGEGLLKYGIAFLYRQQRKNIGIGGDALTEPQISVMDQ